MFDLHLGDCSNWIDYVTADAVIADPPYGQNYQPSRGNDSRKRVMRGLEIYNPEWHQIVGEDRPFDPTALLRFRILCLWGANHYADKLPASSGWFIWDKRYGVPSNDQADCEMAWTNQPRAARIYRQLWNGIIREGAENIGRAGAKVHPHQKPEALMMWCVDQLGIKPGMTVFDPYMGSGTTGVACVKLGINFIGCEIEETYFRVAEQRIGSASRVIPLPLQSSSDVPTPVTLPGM